MVGYQLAGVVVPYGHEFRDLGVDETMLRELSELTGGGVLNDPKDTFLINRHKSRLTFDLWPWLVGLVTVMLIPEIALRRMGPGIFGRIMQRFRARGGQGGSGNESPSPS